MFVADCMRTQVFSVKSSSTLIEAIQIMGDHMVGTLPVLDDEQHVVGVVVLDDLLTQFMPRFVHLLRSTDFVHDYGQLEMGPKFFRLARKPLHEIMRPPYFLAETCSLMEAMVFMHKNQVVDVPVVNEDEKLVGLVSSVRVGSLFLVDWLGKLPTDT